MGIKQDIIYGAVCLSLGLFAGREIGVFNSRQNQQVKTNSALEQKIGPNEELYKGMKDSYREITESLYESTRLASEIEKSIQESEKETKSMMIRGFKGSPGSPSGAGFGDLFDEPGQRGPIVDEPGSGTAKGLGDIFKDDEKNYAQKISESLNRSYKHLEKIRENIKAGREATEEAKRLLKTGSDSVPKIPIMPRIPQEISETENLYKKISEDLEKSQEYIAKIRENAKKGMEALEKGRQALKNAGGKVTHTPDCPIIPIPSDKTKEKENKKQDTKEKKDHE